MPNILTLIQGVRTLIPAITSSNGLTDANKIVSTGNDGKLDLSLLPQSNNIGIPASQGFRVFEEFLMNIGSFSSFTSGTGAGCSPINSSTVDNGGKPGICQIATGTTATGQARLGGGSGDNNNRILFGFGKWEFETMIQLPILRNATDEYIMQFGFSDNTNALNAIDAVIFHYNNVSNFWQCRTVSNSVATNIITSIEILANIWYKLRIKIDETADNAEFYIDNVLVTTITNTIPKGTNRQTGISMSIVKTAGTNNRMILTDYVDLISTFNVNR